MRADDDVRAVAVHLLMAAYPDAIDLAAVLRLTAEEVAAVAEQLLERGHGVERVGAEGWRYLLPAIEPPQARLASARRARRQSVEFAAAAPPEPS